MSEQPIDNGDPLDDLIKYPYPSMDFSHYRVIDSDVTSEPASFAVFEKVVTLIITEDQMAQKRRINRASSAVYKLMYELETEDGQPSDNEWMFVFGEILHNMLARRLKYARMARKRWDKEVE